MGLKIFRVEGGRPGKGVKGLSALLQFQLRLAKLVIGPIIFRIKLNNILQFYYRFFEFTLLNILFCLFKMFGFFLFFTGATSDDSKEKADKGQDK